MYINNKQFYEDIKTWQQTRDPKLFELIINKYIKKIARYWINYFKADHIDVWEVINKSYEALDKFDTSKNSSPFSYFTQVTKNNTLLYMSHNKKYILPPSFVYIEHHGDEILGEWMEDSKGIRRLNPAISLSYTEDYGLLLEEDIDRMLCSQDDSEFEYAHIDIKIREYMQGYYDDNYINTICEIAMSLAEGCTITEAVSHAKDKYNIKHNDMYKHSILKESAIKILKEVYENEED